jgi:hypothetical protein
MQNYRYIEVQRSMLAPVNPYFNSYRINQQSQLTTPINSNTVEKTNEQEK